MRFGRLVFQELSRRRANKPTGSAPLLYETTTRPSTWCLFRANGGDTREWLNR